jgi:ubiquinone biosynthesis protein
LKHRVRLPRNVLLLLKTFIQTEALGKILGSDASILEVTRPFAKELLKRGYDTRSIAKNIDRDTRVLGGYLKNIPKYANDILRQIAGGKQKIELLHSGLEQTNAQIEKGINRLTVGVIISASILAAAMVLNSSQKVLEFTTDFFGLQTISLTAVLGIVGYSVATLLGVWLIVSILRSGRY